MLLYRGGTDWLMTRGDRGIWNLARAYDKLKDTGLPWSCGWPYKQTAVPLCYKTRRKLVRSPSVSYRFWNPSTRYFHDESGTSPAVSTQIWFLSGDYTNMISLRWWRINGFSEGDSRCGITLIWFLAMHSKNSADPVDFYISTTVLLTLKTWIPWLS